MAYIDDLNTMTEVTFDKILGLASHYLPEVKRNAPWIGLNHGTKVLQSEMNFVNICVHTETCIETK